MQVDPVGAAKTLTDVFGYAALGVITLIIVCLVVYLMYMKVIKDYRDADVNRERERGERDIKIERERTTQTVAMKDMAEIHKDMTNSLQVSLDIAKRLADAAPCQAVQRDDGEHERRHSVRGGGRGPGGG